MTAATATATSPDRGGEARMPIGLVAGQFLLVGVLAALAGLSFSVAFRPADLWLPVLGAALFAALVAFAVNATKQRPVVFSVVVSLAAFVGFTAVVLFKGVPTAGLVDGLRNGPARLLTTILPADPDPGLLVVPVTVTWLVSLLGCELARRTRSAIGPAAPALLGVTIGLTFGSDGGAAQLTTALAASFVVAAAGLLLLRADGLGGPAPGAPAAPAAPVTPVTPQAAVAALRRRLLLGLPVLFGVTGVALLIGPRLPLATARAPFQLREHHDEPRQLSTAVNPMALVGAWQKQAALGDDPPLFVVTTSAPVGRYRLAVLDRYDGEQWTSGSTFERAASELPPDLVVATRSTEITEHIEVRDALPGFWLPTVDRPTRVTGVDAMFDRTTGMLIALDGSAAGARYDVRSNVVQPTEAEVLAGHIATSPDAATYTVLAPPADPKQLDVITSAAKEAMSGSTNQLDQVIDLQNYLAKNPEAFKPAPAVQPKLGHSYGVLGAWLGDATEPVHVGSPEQYAALFALMARSRQIPARVVVGFRPDPQHVTEIRAGDVDVWPEVLFEGFGWVPFDPMPKNEEAVRKEQERAQAQGTLDPGNIVQDAGSNAANVLGVDPPPPAPAPAGLSTIEKTARAGGVVAGTVVVILAALVGAVSTIRRRRRRRRRHAATTKEQVVGAWDEALDGLAEQGLWSTTSLTAKEVVDRGSTMCGEAAAAPLRQLGHLANLARFRRREPTNDQVLEAWSHVEQFEAESRALMSTRQKLIRRVDLRPLVFTRR